MEGILPVEYIKKGSIITGEIYKETTVIKRFYRFMIIAEFTKLAKSVK
jgi:hypothetical protein